MLNHKIVLKWVSEMKWHMFKGIDNEGATGNDENHDDGEGNI